MAQNASTIDSPTKKESRSLPLLDLLLIHDTTAGQEPYLRSSQSSIMGIWETIEASDRISKKDGLRTGLIAFRDYHLQDNGYVVEKYSFTSNSAQMRDNLSGLHADGGGDLPDASEAAFNEIFNMEWRPSAVKVVMLITDAPPHGIGEEGDEFPEGSPAGYDPLRIARELRVLGVSINIMACEMSPGKHNDYALDFYSAIASITSGAMYPLTQPDQLAPCIIGSILEKLEIMRLSLDYREEIVHRYTVEKEPLEEIVHELHEKLQRKQTKITTAKVGNISRSSPDALHNMLVFSESDSLADARSKLRKIVSSRHTPAFKATSSSSRPAIPLVEYTLINSGREAITYETFQDDVQHLTKRALLPNHICKYPVELNTILNFVLEIGRFQKTLSRTFSSNQTLDLWQIWEGTE